MKDYGNAIRTLRKKNNITQHALAEKLNISGQAVSKWENNSSQPDFDTIVKMTEIFGVTMNEFAELCLNIDADSNVSNEKSKNSDDNEKGRQPLLIGVCSECGSSIYNQENVGTSSPKLICKKCKDVKAKKAEQEAAMQIKKEKARRAAVKSDFVKATVIPAVIIGVITTILAIIMLSSDVDNVWASIGGLVGLSVLVYIMVVQICWDEVGFIGTIFFWSITKTFTMPGVIFSLNLDGLIWLITVKLGLAILSFLLSALVAILGVGLCLVLSPFSFVPSLIANINRVARGEEA